MKAKNWWQGTLLFLAVSVAACSSTLPQASVTTNTPHQLSRINACYSSTAGGATPIWYAYEKGLFIKYGLDVKLVSIKSGSEAAVALIAKNVDFCQIAGTPVANAVVAGEDLVMILGLINTYTYSLIVTSDIQTAQDLKGKTLAISKAGSASDLAVRTILRRLNLQPDKDVAIVSIGEDGERLLSMETGKIAGTVIAPPNVFKAKQKGYRVLTDMSSFGLPYQHTGIATSKSYIKANRESTLKFAKAIVEAVALMTKDREGTMAIMAKYSKLDSKADADILNETYEALVQKTIVKTPYPSLLGMQAILANLQYENPKASNIKPEDTIDMSIIKELETSGFISNLYK